MDIEVSRVVYGMESDTYRAAPGFAHSDGKRLRRSPWHYKALTLPRAPELVKAPAPQQASGIMAHAATLEPHEFDTRYVVGPEINKNTNAWKAFADECVERKVEPITQQQRDTAFAMAASALALPDFASVIEGAAREVSLWWKCPATGVLVKARPDAVKVYPPGIPVIADEAHPIAPERLALIHDKGFAILADLKTTDDASPEEFAASTARYSYHTQAAWYSEGVERALNVPVLSFLFCVVEREYPYAAATYTLDDTAMQVGADLNRATRELYAQCLKADSWPGYPQDTRDLALPAWYMKRYLMGQPV
ncbi:hypothetical protein GCM10028796_47020 [Ramlibacter monticola]|uniref:PD-(D/E)XK nuclease-like domain-containing protein n=1 Tax=Ramlibacter monticola TaxID=1926872 RepID=A0A936Z580_9BURK|nr:PD-(D/E)XK nuclease-like domain-containing protein [Ramlibacter monticola]MBL0394326.1 PD-(D/E)XK nuclease-like domain-containing protein [Ramlibacter monticola]